MMHSNFAERAALQRKYQAVGSLAKEEVEHDMLDSDSWHSLTDTRGSITICLASIADATKTSSKRLLHRHEESYREGRCYREGR